RVADFTNIDQIAIEQASLAIGLELIKNNALFEKEIQFREAVFNQLTASISERDLQQAISYIGWEKDWQVQSLVLEGRESPLWDIDQIIDKERFIQAIEKHAQNMGIKPLIFTRAMQLVIILPIFRSGVLQRFINEIGKISKDKQIYYGIGRATSI